MILYTCQTGGLCTLYCIFFAGEESPAIEISSILGDGIAEQRRALIAGLADRTQSSRPRAASKQKESRGRPGSQEIHEVEDSSDEDRRRNRSRSSRRRSRSRSPTPRRNYSEYNWVMLGQFWPEDQRPAVPYQGIFACPENLMMVSFFSAGLNINIFLIFFPRPALIV